MGRSRASSARSNTAAWKNKDRLLRAAAFKGLRDDRPAEEIVLEALQKRSKPRIAPAPMGTHLTHPERNSGKRRESPNKGWPNSHTHCRRHSSPYRWPSVEFAAMPLGHRRQVLFRQASVAWVGCQRPSDRYRRQRADGRNRWAGGILHVPCAGGRCRNPPLGIDRRSSGKAGSSDF